MTKVLETVPRGMRHDAPFSAIPLADVGVIVSHPMIAITLCSGLCSGLSAVVTSPSYGLPSCAGAHPDWACFMHSGTASFLLRKYRIITLLGR